MTEVAQTTSDLRGGKMPRRYLEEVVASRSGDYFVEEILQVYIEYLSMGNGCKFNDIEWHFSASGLLLFLFLFLFIVPQAYSCLHYLTVTGTRNAVTLAASASNPSAHPPVLWSLRRKPGKDYCFFFVLLIVSLPHFYFFDTILHRLSPVCLLVKKLYQW